MSLPDALAQMVQKRRGLRRSEKQSPWAESSPLSATTNSRPGNPGRLFLYWPRHLKELRFGPEPAACTSASAASDTLDPADSLALSTDSPRCVLRYSSA